MVSYLITSHFECIGKSPHMRWSILIHNVPIDANLLLHGDLVQDHDDVLALFRHGGGLGGLLGVVLGDGRGLGGGLDVRHLVQVRQGLNGRVVLGLLGEVGVAHELHGADAQLDAVVTSHLLLAP